MKAPPSTLPGRDGCVLAIEMTDRDVVERIALMLNKAVIAPRIRNEKHKQTYAVRARGASARYWMNRLRPLMGVRRRAQIDAALASSAPASRRGLHPGELEALLREFQSGTRVVKIAARFGVAREHVYRIAKKHQVVRPPT